MQSERGSAGQQSQSPTKPAENQKSKPAANSPQELPDKVQPKPGVDTSAQNNPKYQTSQAPKTTEKKKADRMFYVMPNYLTVGNQSQVPSIKWKEKFSVTLKGTFDPYEFVIVGVGSWRPAATVQPKQ